LPALWSHADDVSILGAIGSYAQGWDDVRTHLLGAVRHLDSTELSVEFVLTTASADLAVTVVLERMIRRAGEPRTRTLPTTQVHRREPGAWRLILRHANLVTADDEQRERDLLGRKAT
jgi:ketosteroid isomerase-like protein